MRAAAAVRLVLAGALAAPLVCGGVVWGDTALDKLIGPAATRGSNPWTWYEVVETAGADSLRPYVTALPSALNSPLPGTATITGGNGNWHLSGSGTNWASTLQAGDWLSLRWTYSGGGYAYYFSIVDSVISDTDIKLQPWPFNAPTGATVYTVIKRDASFGGWETANPSSNTFYDLVAGLYRVWRATGVEQYRTDARALCDGWVRLYLGFGLNLRNPRDSSWEGIAICAADTGNAAYWDALTYPLEYDALTNPTVPPTRTSWLGVGYPSYDKREDGYKLRATALVAQYHPDAGVRAAYCTRLSNLLTNVWLYHQAADGRFEEFIFGGNADYPDWPIDGLYGSSPWRTVALTSHALVRSWEACDACGLTSLRDQVMASLQSAATWWWNHRTPEDGTYYHVGSATIEQLENLGLGFTGVRKYSTQVAFTQGSAAVTGTGTSFTTQIAAGEWIASNTRRTVYQVASVESGTALTLAIPFAEASVAESSWSRTVSTSAGCGNCEVDPYDHPGRSDAVLMPTVFAWLYYRTGVADWKTRFQRVSGAAYGGPNNGPGGSNPCAGPHCTGNYGNMHEALISCNETGWPYVPPCSTGGYGPAYHRAKQYAMSTGAGRSGNGIAFVLLKDGAAPDPPLTTSMVRGGVVRGGRIGR